MAAHLALMVAALISVTYISAQQQPAGPMVKVVNFRCKGARGKPPVLVPGDALGDICAGALNFTIKNVGQVNLSPQAPLNVTFYINEACPSGAQACNSSLGRIMEANPTVLTNLQVNDTRDLDVSSVTLDSSTNLGPVPCGPVCITAVLETAAGVYQRSVQVVRKCNTTGVDLSVDVDIRGFNPNANNSLPLKSGRPLLPQLRESSVRLMVSVTNNGNRDLPHPSRNMPYRVWVFLRKRSRQREMECGGTGMSGMSGDSGRSGSRSPRPQNGTRQALSTEDMREMEAEHFGCNGDDMSGDDVMIGQIMIRRGVAAGETVNATARQMDSITLEPKPGQTLVCGPAEMIFVVDPTHDIRDSNRSDNKFRMRVNITCADEDFTNFQEGCEVIPDISRNGHRAWVRFVTATNARTMVMEDVLSGIWSNIDGREVLDLIRLARTKAMAQDVVNMAAEDGDTDCMCSGAKDQGEDAAKQMLERVMAEARNMSAGAAEHLTDIAGDMNIDPSGDFAASMEQMFSSLAGFSFGQNIGDTISSLGDHMANAFSGPGGNMANAFSGPSGNMADAFSGSSGNMAGAFSGPSGTSGMGMGGPGGGFDMENASPASFLFQALTMGKDKVANLTGLKGEKMEAFGCVFDTMRKMERLMNASNDPEDLPRRILDLFFRMDDGDCPSGKSVYSQLRPCWKFMLQAYMYLSADYAVRAEEAERDFCGMRKTRQMMASGGNDFANKDIQELEDMMDKMGNSTKADKRSKLFEELGLVEENGQALNASQCRDEMDGDNDMDDIFEVSWRVKNRMIQYCIESPFEAFDRSQGLRCKTVATCECRNCGNGGNGGAGFNGGMGGYSGDMGGYNGGMGGYNGGNGLDGYSGGFNGGSGGFNGGGDAFNGGTGGFNGGGDAFNGGTGGFNG